MCKAKGLPFSLFGFAPAQDMNTGFDMATMMSGDNIHPNHAGYHFIANQWYSVIGSLLPK